MTLAQKLRQEGRQEGRLISLREYVLEALEIRFAEIPNGLREVIEGINEETRLRALHRAAIQSASMEEFADGL